METSVREPKQKRAIEKKEKIVEAGFQLICENGYYNTNTAEIAKKADVSIGIIYQYFTDKHDIFMEGLKIHGDEIFFPILSFDLNDYDIQNFDQDLRILIENQIKNHKLSQKAHEEITAMTHSDNEVANYFYQKELEVTENVKQMLLKNQFNEDLLTEKVHIAIGLIDNLCHEVVYHNHKNMNYEKMINLVIQCIKSLFNKK